MPRREAFAIVLQRAKSRGEIQVFDLLSGLLPTDEPVETYMRRIIQMLLQGQ
jgi:hypothetical protein